MRYFFLLTLLVSCQLYSMDENELLLNSSDNHKIEKELRSAIKKADQNQLQSLFKQYPDEVDLVLKKIKNDGSMPQLLSAYVKDNTIKRTIIAGMGLILLGAKTGLDVYFAIENPYLESNSRRALSSGLDIAEDLAWLGIIGYKTYKIFHNDDQLKSNKIKYLIEQCEKKAIN